MKKVKIVGFQKVADFKAQNSNETIRGSRIYYVAELSDFQKNSGASGMEAGSQFLSANRFNYPDIEVGAFYDLDIVKKTAVSLSKVNLESNNS